jgi:hypothetical protein
MRLRVGSRAVSVRRNRDGRFLLRNRVKDSAREPTAPLSPRTLETGPASTTPSQAAVPSGLSAQQRLAVEQIQSLAQEVADAWVSDHTAVELVSQQRR